MLRAVQREAVMRAERMIQLVQLLQARQARTAEDLAQQLGVSARTIYRDLEALSVSGIPVCTQPGPQGGVSIMEGWRSSLQGLSPTEAQALATFQAPAALDALGLSAPLRRALRKIAAAQPDAEYARQRLHIDPSSWFHAGDELPQLALLRDAIWHNQAVRFGYRDVEGHESQREASPYGLVLKGERWYLVAGTPAGLRVFRGSRLQRVEVGGRGAPRPSDFDLPSFWAAWSQRFREERPSYVVRLRLTPDAAEALATVRPPAEQEAIRGAAAAPDGTRTLSLDFEREGIALATLATLPRGAEVLAPDALRARLLALGESLCAQYGPPPPKR